MSATQNMLIITLVAISFTSCRKNEPGAVIPANKHETVYTIPDDYSFKDDKYPLYYHYNVAPHGKDTSMGTQTQVPVSLIRVNDKQLRLQMVLNKVTVDDTLMLDSMFVTTYYDSAAQPHKSYIAFARLADGDWTGRLEADHRGNTTDFVAKLKYDIKKANSEEHIFAQTIIAIE